MSNVHSPTVSMDIGTGDPLLLTPDRSVGPLMNNLSSSAYSALLSPQQEEMKCMNNLRDQLCHMVSNEIMYDVNNVSPYSSPVNDNNTTVSISDNFLNQIDELGNVIGISPLPYVYLKQENNPTSSSSSTSSLEHMVNTQHSQQQQTGYEVTQQLYPSTTTASMQQQLFNLNQRDNTLLIASDWVNKNPLNCLEDPMLLSSSAIAHSYPTSSLSLLISGGGLNQDSGPSTPQGSPACLFGSLPSNTGSILRDLSHQDIVKNERIQQLKHTNNNIIPCKPPMAMRSTFVDPRAANLAVGRARPHPYPKRLRTESACTPLTHSTTTVALGPSSDDDVETMLLQRFARHKRDAVSESASTPDYVKTMRTRNAPDIKGHLSSLTADDFLSRSVPVTSNVPFTKTTSRISNPRILSPTMQNDLAKARLDQHIKDLYKCYCNQDKDQNKQAGNGRSSGYSKKELSLFWEYNAQKKGPKGKSMIMKWKEPNPHKMVATVDPVFSPEAFSDDIKIKHSGKARKGDGNDLTPRPDKLYKIGISIYAKEDELKMLPKNVEKKEKHESDKREKNEIDKKEKNKISSRICRERKKAKNEANKIVLAGLNEEKGRLLKSTPLLKNGLVEMLALEKVTEADHLILSSNIQTTYPSPVPKIVEYCRELQICGTKNTFLLKILLDVVDGGNGGLRRILNKPSLLPDNQLSNNAPGVNILEQNTPMDCDDCEDDSDYDDEDDEEEFNDE